MVLPLNGDDNGGQIQPEMEQVNYNIITLTRFLTEEQSKHKEATGDFT
jgi:fructose-1,6-bisphosphatase I